MSPYIIMLIECPLFPLPHGHIHQLSSHQHSLLYYALQYLLKVNESRSKKGVDLLNHLVDYYQSQTRYVIIG